MLWTLLLLMDHAFGLLVCLLGLVLAVGASYMVGLTVYYIVGFQIRDGYGCACLVPTQTWTYGALLWMPACIHQSASAFVRVALMNACYACVCVCGIVTAAYACIYKASCF